VDYQAVDGDVFQPLGCCITSVELHLCFHKRIDKSKWNMPKSSSFLSTLGLWRRLVIAEKQRQIIAWNSGHRPALPLSWQVPSCWQQLPIVLWLRPSRYTPPIAVAPPPALPPASSWGGYAQSNQPQSPLPWPPMPLWGGYAQSNQPQSSLPWQNRYHPWGHDPWSGWIWDGVAWRPPGQGDPHWY
jgi:hypothetical protein